MVTPFGPGAIETNLKPGVPFLGIEPATTLTYLSERFTWGVKGGKVAGSPLMLSDALGVAGEREEAVHASVLAPLSSRSAQRASRCGGGKVWGGQPGQKCRLCSFCRCSGDRRGPDWGPGEGHDVFFHEGGGGGEGKGGHEHSLEPKALCLLAASGLLLPLADELWLGEGKKKAGRGRGGGILGQIMRKDRRSFTSHPTS